jgi:hypothetical protein
LRRRQPLAAPGHRRVHRKWQWPKRCDLRNHWGKRPDWTDLHAKPETKRNSDAETKSDVDTHANARAQPNAGSYAESHSNTNADAAPHTDALAQPNTGTGPHAGSRLRQCSYLAYGQRAQRFEQQ